MNTHSIENDTTAEQEPNASVMDSAAALLSACRRYEQGRRQAPTPALTLLSDSEVEDFLGTIPTLTPDQFERLETLVQMDRDRRDTEHDEELETHFEFAEVA